ncbi:uncharacterized protein [Montipora capricornis]|uniref:uncharacterized protein n=1 Tax=Montipora capricornis TaxID=246305 RepID=UPI0035F218C4
MSRVHDLGDYTPPLSVKIKIVDTVDRYKLLGNLLSEDLKWTEHVNNVTSSCFGVLAVLRKIKNMTPQETKKSLVQSLVLPKITFNDTVTYPLPMFLQKLRMQRVQNAAAGFVLNRYCSEEDVLKLGWLPTLENTQLNILKLGPRALYNNNWPEYLTLSRHNPSSTLRSSSTPLLQISLLKGTFQDSVANLYNDLPASISSITDYHHFVKESAKILKAKAIMRLA